MRQEARLLLQRCACKGERARELAGSLPHHEQLRRMDETALLGVRRAGIELRTWARLRLRACRDREDGRMADSWAKPYDIAPMPVIISEAGGCFTDWQGAPGSTADRASRPTAHPLALLRLLGLSRAMSEALVRRRDLEAAL